jgi:Spherulation-specific family 4
VTIRPIRLSRPLLIAIAVAAGGAVTLGVTSHDAPKAKSAACRGALVPAYRGLDALAHLAGRPAQGRIVIVNPENGPGMAAQPAYRQAIDAQRRAGAAVLGYVHTDYGSRDPAAVLADVQRYRSWYGVGGVFLDEVPTSEGQLSYYRSIAAPLRASGERVVLNPGLVPARGYFDIADIVVTFEGPVGDYAAAVGAMPAWLRALPRARVAHLVYGASEQQASQAAALDAAGHFYATSGTLPDPWGTLPPYLEALEARLARCG